MARSDEQETAAPQPVLMVNTEQYGAQELHRQQEVLRKQGIKLNETIPGGKYLDGPNATTYHDAWGNPVGGDGKAQSAPVAVAQGVAQIQTESEVDAAIAALEARRETLQAEAEARKAQQKEQEKAEAAAEKQREAAHAQQEKDAAAAAKKSGAKR